MLLAHRICQYTARTPLLHRTSRVLCHQVALHRPLRSFYHAPSRHGDPKKPERTELGEIRLNWSPGSGNEREKPESKWTIEVEPLKRGRRPRIPQEPPVLNWTSGSGPSEVLGSHSSPLPLPEIEDPKVPWLSPSRLSLKPRLDWDQTIKQRTGWDLKELLIEAAFGKARRRRTRLGAPKGELIKRYPTFAKALRLVRKVASGARNASEELVLGEPSIKIGETPVLGNRENPRLRGYRLRFIPFDHPETIQGSLRRKILVRRTTTRKSLYSVHARRIRKIEARRRHEDARNGIIRPKPENTKQSISRLAAGSRVLTKNPPDTTTNTESQKDVQPLRIASSNKLLLRRVESVTRGPQSLLSRRRLISRVLSDSGNIPKVYKMDKPNDNSGKAAEMTKEAVPNDTNIEIPPATQDESNSKAEAATGVMEEVIPSETSLEIPASTEEATSKPELKRVFASPSRKTEWQPKKKQRTGKKKPMKEGGADEVLQRDVQALLSTLNLTEEDIEAAIERLPEPFDTTLELTVTELSSTGDGLGLHDNRVYVVPFTVPGDKVEVKLRHHYEMHTMAELIKVLIPSPDRNDSLISCKYFATCAGCQFQMLPYEKQLENKRHVVQKAFTNFSNLPAKLLPEVLDTMGSPLQYGYRTKLTPHFDGPRRGGFPPGCPTPNIGFNPKSGRQILDIEDCPIGTDTVREGIKKQRAWVKENLQTYKRGATLLLRESTERVPIKEAEEGAMEVGGEGKKYIETKKCVTNSNERSVEYFGDFRFDSPAGSFFQNNNSILKNVCTKTISSINSILISTIVYRLHP